MQYLTSFGVNAVDWCSIIIERNIKYKTQIFILILVIIFKFKYLNFLKLICNVFREKPINKSKQICFNFILLEKKLLKIIKIKI